ncbi:MAG: hypothetical protein KJ626_03600 [Verrucomicrobia bacterium]|nr:hypothetical protein [Verrucomicrobiota bacterium]
MFETAIIWLHILSFGALFGSLLALYWLANASHNDEPHSHIHPERLLNILVGLVLITGFSLLFLNVMDAHAQSISLGAHFWGSVGVKLILLLIVGGLIGMTGKKPIPTKKHAWAASMVLIALAAFIGLTL